VPIAARFWFVLVALVLSTGVLGIVGFRGLSSIRGSADRVRLASADSDQAQRTSLALATLRADIRAAIDDTATGQTATLRSQVEADITALDLQLALARQRYASEPAELRSTIAQQTDITNVATHWRETTDATVDTPRTAASAAAANQRLDLLISPMIVRAQTETARAAREELLAGNAVGDRYSTTQRTMIEIFGATLLLGIVLVLWLIRSVVPRTRTYSRFAAHVSAGELGQRLNARGGDELAELGRSLDDLVGRHEEDESYRRSQSEFVNALQVTETEHEAHALIKRHLERVNERSTIVVLNRNNSHDRLEPRTPVDAGSALARGLEGATPRSCLAVRFARRHEGGGELDPLLRCSVCGKTAAATVCDPLLVGGEVIGSVLVTGAEALGARGDRHMRDSVAQAAPVLANLRNLALAEHRASTDALTGLPNKRDVQDTLKRMVAYTARIGAPLSVALLDLDHFKQINDTLGHERGDEVLAATAAAMRSTLRDSDFIGRYGGEEFLLLLPDTDRTGAATVLESIRSAIARVTVPGVDRAISASIGVAVHQQHVDAETLVRGADRALYLAKSGGRNRVEFADPVHATAPTVEATAA
jgi:diguanylate cyclase (GGDEF)-like protein